LLCFKSKYDSSLKGLNKVERYTQRNPYRCGYDVNPINITYFSFHKEFDDEERGPKKVYLRDDLKDVKAEASGFDGNLNQKKYLD